MLEDFIEKVKENKVTALLSLIIAGLLVSFYLLSQTPQPNENRLPAIVSSGKKHSVSSISQKETDKSPSSSGKITVDIKGAVKKEGVYTLSSQSRLNDAVEAAGGFTAEADRKSVNLAQKLSDEAVIYVAFKGEDISVVGKPDNSQNANNSIDTEQSDKINLNTATLADLQTISGIGEKRAQDIIDYRDSNGGFSSLEDLKNISGIGDKTFEKLKDMVTIE
ncbi:helix-hairpin-helix domain-containing protein [Streptococcus ferus]|uniref:helix-hairpin-helix domain-containing protein n=1 Tax=Streptococcus ferus TaxID=1345 RepID=UPI003518D1CC